MDMGKMHRASCRANSNNGSWLSSEIPNRFFSFSRFSSMHSPYATLCRMATILSCFLSYTGFDNSHGGPYSGLDKSVSGGREIN